VVHTTASIDAAVPDVAVDAPEPTDGFQFVFPEAGALPDRPPCTPVTCEQTGGRYCGRVGNGCGEFLECGDCPNGGVCGGAGIKGLCAGGPMCQPLVCANPGGNYCGTVGDGCGRALDCGGCPDGQLCGGAGKPNLCAGGSTCKPVMCDNPNGKYCGMIGDGCGHVIDCGGCPGTQVCGGAGTPNLCGGGPGCTPLSCMQASGRYCGMIGDGCGRMIDCGGCTAPDTCGTGGIPNVCSGPNSPCFNLCLKQATCMAGTSTVLTGTVLAPTPPKFGMPDPIPSAIVYVPNTMPEPFAAGVSCQACNAQATGSPLVSALSGPDGKFRLEGVPVGDNIPLVIQLGRWRRQIVVPKVEPCASAELPPELTRLPRNKNEGDIPLMALATGGVDGLECVLRKIGIDEAEFTAPAGTGRVHLYKSNGAVVMPGPTPSRIALTGSLDNLRRYDQVIFACEGMHVETRPDAEQMNLAQYADGGGRVFLTHFNYNWIYRNPAWSSTATWNVRQPWPAVPFTGIVDQSFPKGMVFAKWLEVTRAQSAPGQILIEAPRHDIHANGVNAPAQRWIYSNAPAPTGTTQHYTFNTPRASAEAQQCGRVLFTDFHVNDSSGAVTTDKVFPTECDDMPMSPQEKVLEFMLFDLASCVKPELPPLPVQPPAAPPATPPVPPPLPVAPPPPPPPPPPEIQ
jgi:hypothetical protein